MSSREARAARGMLSGMSSAGGVSAPGDRPRLGLAVFGVARPLVVGASGVRALALSAGSLGASVRGSPEMDGPRIASSSGDRLAGAAAGLALGIVGLAAAAGGGSWGCRRRRRRLDCPGSSSLRCWCVCCCSARWRSRRRGGVVGGVEGSGRSCPCRGRWRRRGGGRQPWPSSAVSCSQGGPLPENRKSGDSPLWLQSGDSRSWRWSLAVECVYCR